jgi:2-polyprenyl-6-methoxyphenol hydroxylase-like FAD-dependent oxidoreductase
MMPKSTHEVLVVGAGPTGLTLACELCRREVGCRVVDAAEGPSGLSRATALWPRTLEVLDDMSIAERALARGRKLHAVNYSSDGRRITRFEVHRLSGTLFPFVLSIPQSQTENMLVERLTELGGGVEWGTRLRRLSNEAEGVRAMLERPAGGEEEEPEFTFVVGCDGAHSAVRTAAGIRFVGAAYEDSFLLADVPLDTSLTRDEAHFFLSPAGVLVVIPLPGDLWRVVVDLREVGRDVELEPALLQSIVDARGPGGIRLGSPTWATVFRIHRRTAEAMRRGRCFLAGDAAHVHSPAGGQGLNAGMQDAYNLAWKLGLAVNGVSALQLLESYEAERQPIIRQVIRGTDLMTRLGLLRSEGTRRLRDLCVTGLDRAGVLRRYAGPLMAGLAQNYRRSPLVAEHGGDAVPMLRSWIRSRAGPRPGERGPDAPLLEQHALSSTRLSRVQRDPRHTLLIFGEALASPVQWDELRRLAASIRARHGKHIAVHLVTTALANATDVSVLVDQERLAHRRYGASAGYLYLIRPDGYVGYRSRTPDAGTLLMHLETYFKERA